MCDGVLRHRAPGGRSQGRGTVSLLGEHPPQQHSVQVLMDSLADNNNVAMWGNMYILDVAFFLRILLDIFGFRLLMISSFLPL